MKLYVLQTRISECADADKVYIFTKFENLCKEFGKQFNQYKNMCEQLIACEVPNENEAGEVYGNFSFLNADGSVLVGGVYDYHTLDED